MPASTLVEKKLDANELSRLCSSDGQCLSLYLPANRPGDPSSANVTRVKRALQSGAPEALLAPLRELSDSALLDSGGRALAIFSQPQSCSVYRLDGDTGERMALAARPLIRPLLKEALTARTMFVLGLSRKRVRLWKFNRPDCEEIALPPKTPRSLEEAGEFEAPDHVLANRSSAGGSTGAMGGVRFTTLSDRESQPEYLHHFFTLVDRGLHPLVREMPLVLAGVLGEVAAYRKAARLGHVLEDQIEGAPEKLTATEIAQRAHGAAESEFRRQGENVLRIIAEMTERNRVAQGVHVVEVAAKQGRLHQVVMAAESNDDALNTIAVDAIKTGGQVFELAGEAMRDQAPVAAVLRY